MRMILAILISQACVLAVFPCFAGRNQEEIRRKNRAFQLMELCGVRLNETNECKFTRWNLTTNIQTRAAVFALRHHLNLIDGKDGFIGELYLLSVTKKNGKQEKLGMCDLFIGRSCAMSKLWAFENLADTSISVADTFAMLEVKRMQKGVVLYKWKNPFRLRALDLDVMIVAGNIAMRLQGIESAYDVACEIIGMVKCASLCE